MEPLLMYLDAVTIPVPDLDQNMAFYCGVLGHQLLWRNDAVGQVGLSTPQSNTKIVLTTRQPYEPDWKVLVEPIDIPIGRLAVVEDPFGNRLVLLDSTKGTYETDKSGTVVCVN